MITSIVGFFASSPLVRKIALYGAVALAVVLFLLGLRKSGERAGAQKIKLENAHAEAVALKKILAVPVPTTRDDTGKLLDDGTF